MRLNSTWLVYATRLLLCLMLVAGCTKTPTETAEVPAKQNKIAGKVALADFINPTRTFIWLEGFDLGTRADAQGDFELTLPEKSHQSVLPGGVEGVFKLYFFNANYFIKTFDLVVLNGEFVFAKGDLLQTGDLSRQPTLANIVTIRTVTTSPEIRASYDSTLAVSVLISPVNLTDSVKIRFPDLAEQMQAKIYFEDAASGKSLTLSSGRFTVRELGREIISIDDLSSEMIVRDRPILLEVEFDWRNGLAGEGEYEIVPFILIDHQEVPEELLANMGFSASNLLESYRRIPYGIHAAKLTVLPVD